MVHAMLRAQGLSCRVCYGAILAVIMQMAQMAQMADGVSRYLESNTDKSGDVASCHGRMDEQLQRGIEQQRNLISTTCIIFFLGYCVPTCPPAANVSLLCGCLHYLLEASNLLL
jgi:hypothetical protein